MNKNTHPIRLLTLEKSQNTTERWVKLFRAEGLSARVQYIENLEALEEALGTGLWDILLTVEQTSMVQADQALKSIQRLKQDVPVIVMLDKTSRRTAGEWLSKGAADAIPETEEQHLLLAILREKAGLEQRQKRQQLAKALDEAEQRCQLLLDNAAQAIAYVHEGMHVDANPAYLELFGYEDTDELAGTPLIDMISSKDQPLLKKLVKHFKPDGEQPPVDCELADIHGQTFPATVLLSKAVYDDEPCIQVLVKAHSPAIAAQPVGLELEEKSDNSHFLKSLVHRSEFFEHLGSEQSPATLAYLKLDNYDAIRQTAGVEGSIAVQETVTRLLTDHLPTSTISHYGDEVFLLSVADNETTALDQLRQSIESSLIPSGKQTLYTTASIGLSEKGRSKDKSIMEQAQLACQIAAEQGGNEVNLFSERALTEIDANKGDRVAMIRHALENDNLRLLFQPIISVTGEGQGYYEVLLRMLNPDGKEVPASEFVPVAEENGLMTFIDRWVIRQAVKQLAKRHRQGESHRLMIHISQASLEDEEFAVRLARLIEAADIPGNLLVLQMNESLVHQHLTQVIRFVESLKPVGCLFGMTQLSGESRSLKILEHVNLTFAKVDPLFTKKVERNDDAQLKKVVHNLKRLNKVVIMPRIESPQTLTRIWQLGVDYAQGFYLQPPAEDMNYDFSS